MKFNAADHLVSDCNFSLWQSEKCCGFRFGKILLVVEFNNKILIVEFHFYFLIIKAVNRTKHNIYLTDGPKRDSSLN